MGTGAAADPPQTGNWELSLYKYLDLDGDYTRAATAETGTTSVGDPLFTTPDGNLTLRPYYIRYTQPVSSYFRRVESAVVFGEGGTSVVNRKRDNGLHSYDVPV